MGKIKVLHIASFNGNIGDNANHNGFRRRLVDTLGREVNFTNLEMREFYQSWNLRDFNSEEFINLSNEHDLVVIGGGNFFELNWDYSHTGTTVNLSEDTLDKIGTPILFHGLGCDIAKGASDNAIGKFKNFLDRITNDDNILVSVRNDGSYETIQKLYGDIFDNKIYRVPDGAFFMKVKSFDFPEVNGRYRSIGINIVSDMKEIRFNNKTADNISYDEFIEGFALVLNNFLKNNQEHQLILFPHIYSDLIAIYNLLEKIEDQYRRTRVVIAPCLTGEGADEYIFGLYKECDFIMGMRFHSNVCAITENIPTIALSSYKKIIDLYNEIGLNDRVIEVNKQGFEENMNRMMEGTINSLNEIKKDYMKINKNIYNESLEFYESVKEWFNQNIN